MAPGQVPERGAPQREGHTRGLFSAALAGIGGPQRVLLVGELWDRSPKRGLLQDFTRDVFGPHGGAQCEGCTQTPGMQDAVCAQGPLIPERCAPPGRCLRPPLIFALFRLSAVQTPAERPRLREILRDVRRRHGGRGTAVVGVIVLPPDPGLPQPLPASLPTGDLVAPGGSGATAGPTSSGVPGSPVENGPLDSPASSAPLGALDSPAPLGTPYCSAPQVAPDSPAGTAPLGAPDSPAGSAPLGAPDSSAGSAPLGAPDSPVGSVPLGAPEPIIFALLSSVFLSEGSQDPPGESPLQTALYQPGDPRSALGVMEAACRALRAADPAPDVEDERKIPTILKCFPWKRRRRKGCSLKAGKNTTGEIPQHPDEGIALKTLCQLSNGACEDNHTDA